MNQFYLYILRLLDPVWKSLGANPGQLQWIISTKLMMDDRRPPAVQMMKQQKRFSNKSTLLTTFISLIYGFFLMALLMAMKGDMLTALTIYFGMFMLMLAMILISDFTSVLIDVRDNFILLPRPVNDRTVLLARLLHIGIHLSKIVIPMAVPGMVAIVISSGFQGLAVLILLVALSTVLTIFLINLIYLLILKITTPGKFKEIINYIQIAFTIFLFASYELLPRLMDNSMLGNIKIESYPWIYCLPSFWFAAVWDLLISHRVPSSVLISSALAVLIPALSVWVVIHFLAPSFNRKLSGFNDSNNEIRPLLTTKTAIRKSTFSERIASVIIQNSTEQAGFIFGWKLTSRSRDFKMKVYPMFGYILVIFLLFMFGGSFGKKGSGHPMKYFRNGPGVIFLIYMASIMIANALILIRFSNSFKAAWIYFISPIKKPGILLRGVMKMLIVKYLFWIYLIIAAFALYLKGISFIPDLILGLANVILISLLLGLYYLKSFPFSEQWSIDQSSGRMMQAFLLMIVTGGIGLLHYFVMDYTPVVIILAVLTLVADCLLINSFGNKTWKQLTS